jgi:hypothetical protein
MNGAREADGRRRGIILDTVGREVRRPERQTDDEGGSVRAVGALLLGPRGDGKSAAVDLDELVG